MNMKRIFIITAAVLIFSPFFISCYYDSEEVLYPSFGCDTTNISYQGKIAALMQNYCTSCHSGPVPEGGISLTTYEDVVSYSARITPAIKHTGNFPMPKNGGKLSDCQILQWDIWLREQMPR